VGEYTAVELFSGLASALALNGVPLDVVAALTADRKYLTVAVVNATDKVQPLDLNISGMRLTGPATVSTGMSMKCWWTIPIPRRMASCGL